MKSTQALALSFLLPLLAFLTNLPLAFSDGRQVADLYGRSIFPGYHYYILPAISDPPGGGLKLGKTGKSECPLTILEDYSDDFPGLRVQFSPHGITTGEIYTGTPLDIKFVDKASCAESSQWLVFVGEATQKACVGIGGAEDHPGQRIIDGLFHIDKSQYEYKLVFCFTGSKTGSKTCLDIGRFDAGNGEKGRRLYLTEHDAFDIVFLQAPSAD